jgi:L-aspartate oxidase
MESSVDVVIVGTGVAGLFCALHLPKDKKVLLITKDALRSSDSYLAQGGISTLKNKEDFNVYVEDTLKAGKYKNSKVAVKTMVRESPKIIQDLLQMGVDFDRMGGELSYTREGAHSTYRILHHKDETGKEITEKLIAKVKSLPNVEIREFTTMYDLLEDKGTCKGVVVRNEHKEVEIIEARKVVWATGGVGGLFEHSTNFSHLTGDSLAIALKRGIKLKDMKAIQIHPTALYTKKKERCFLISEAVRGEGAILLGANKKRFVDELLARDVVANAIKNQMKNDQRDYVYLDMREIGKEKIIGRFPAIYERCKQEGYDVTKELLPVTPAQHYFMGGVAVDLEGRTSMKNLFAIGETACNGVHGANRLASNSLLESLVFAKRAAKALITENCKKRSPFRMEELQQYKEIEEELIKYRSLVLKEITREDGKVYAKRYTKNTYGAECG